MTVAVFVIFWFFVLLVAPCVVMLMAAAVRGKSVGLPALLLICGLGLATVVIYLWRANTAPARQNLIFVDGGAAEVRIIDDGPVAANIDGAEAAPVEVTLVDHKRLTPNSAANSSGSPSTASGERPAWLDRPSGLDTKTRVYRQFLVVGPYSTVEECYQELPHALDRAVELYLGRLPFVPERASLRLPPEMVENQIVREHWVEPVLASFGPMVQLHVMLEFDEPTREAIRALAVEAEKLERLRYAGGGAALLLAILGLLHTGLRLSGSPKNRPGLHATAAGAILAVLPTTMIIVEPLSRSI